MPWLHVRLFRRTRLSSKLYINREQDAGDDGEDYVLEVSCIVCIVDDTPSIARSDSIDATFFHSYDLCAHELWYIERRDIYVYDMHNRQ